MTRDEVLKQICNASRLNTLGLFIGSGFTKAVLENNNNYLAYKWDELLEKCINDFEINLDSEEVKGKSYPEQASIICEKIGKKNRCDFETATIELKKKICGLTNVYPNREQREIFNKLLEGLFVSWIVTTNYDTVIESIYGGRGLTIGPDNTLLSIKDLIPVYHIHGVCNDYNSIIITNEDYIRMFRPDDYRQIRLPMLMKESTVLMMGYALGDMNVITALDWSKHVYSNYSVIEEGTPRIIQLIYVPKPKDEPFYIRDEIIGLEISGIKSFLEELSDFNSDYLDEYEALKNKVDEVKGELLNKDKRNLMRYIDNIDGFQDTIISFMTGISPEFYYMNLYFFDFVRDAITEVNKQSQKYGAFNMYDKKLRIIINILKNIPLQKMSPSFFGMLASSLNDVAEYIGDNIGQSFDAYKTWNDNKNTIPNEIINKLRLFSESGRHNHCHLDELLRKI